MSFNERRISPYYAAVSISIVKVITKFLQMPFLGNRSSGTSDRYGAKQMQTCDPEKISATSVALTGLRGLQNLESIIFLGGHSCYEFVTVRGD